MNNDLISRSALKKAIKSYADDQYAENEYLGECAIMTIIDNAQTVEPFEPDYVGAERLKARQRGYTEGYHYGMEMGKTLNPQIKQGEWVVKSNGTTNYYACSLCGSAGDLQDKFCRKCGADMRGGAE